MLIFIILIVVSYVFIRSPLTQLDFCLWAYHFMTRLGFMIRYLTSTISSIQLQEKSPISRTSLKRDPTVSKLN